MAFRTDHKNTDMQQLMKPGEYEILILEVFEDYTEGGTHMLKMHGVVRNDVEQEYKNKHVWDTMWLTEKAEPFTVRKMNTIDKVLGMPEAEYASYDAWGKAVAGKPVRVKVTHSKPNGDYEPREQVSYYIATRYPSVAHEMPKMANGRPATGPLEPSGFVETDEDIPF